MNLINEVDKPVVKKTIVVYSGRFQPFHKGHYAAYTKLVSKFGDDNVYIATSNDQSSDKSPFSFNEKKLIASKMFDIPSAKFIQIKNPYKPTEILNKYDGQTTQYIAAVGEKDASRLKGKYFKAYNGKAGYGYDEIGYVYTIPAEANPISGTDVRNGLGSDNIDKAKKFFLKAYPKYDEKIFKLITNKLNKKTLAEFGALGGAGASGGFPGGVGTGLVLPGGYINGAPTGSQTSESNKIYDPIGEAVDGYIFKEFCINYFGEEVENLFEEDSKPNQKQSQAQKMGLTYLGFGYYGKNKNGQATHKKDDSGKIVPLDKPKDISKSKGDDTSKIGSQPMMPKASPQTRIDKLNPARAKQKTAIRQGEFEPGLDGDKEKPSGTLEPHDFKSKAEKSSEKDASSKKKSAFDRFNERRREKFAEVIDAIKKDKFNEEESHEHSEVHDPNSKTRKSWKERALNFAAEFPANIVKGAYDVVKSKYHQYKNAVKGIGSIIASLGSFQKPKLGMIDHPDHKNSMVHYSDYQKKDENGKPAYDRVPVYKKAKKGKKADEHGYALDRKGERIQDVSLFGKPKFEKVPIPADNLHPKEKELFDKSYKESKKQKKALLKTIGEAATITASILTSGVAGGVAHGLHGAVGAHGVSTTASAIAGSAIHGVEHHLAGFAHHAAVDYAKHIGAESILLAAKFKHKHAETGAATGGLLHGVATSVGLTEEKDENKQHAAFLSNLVAKMMDGMKNFKPSKELEAKTMLSYIKKKDKLEKKDAIQGLKSMTKLNENISNSKMDSIKNFVEYASKRLKLKENPKISLVGGREFAENKSSLGGFDPITKEIYVSTEGRLTADILRTLAHEMVHRKQDEMGFVRNPEKDGADGSPIENQAHAVAGILMREYGRINKQIYNEAVDKKNVHNINLKLNSISLKRFQSTPTFKNLLHKDQLKNLKVGDNKLIVNNTVWSALQRLEGPGNYEVEKLKENINLDVNPGDTVLMGKFKNKKVQVKDIGKDMYGMPTINGKQATTFRNLDEMNTKDIHLKNIINKYRDNSFRKRINAYLFGKPNYNNYNEVARMLRNMGYDEITKMEKDLNLHNSDLDETIKKVGDKYVVYPKNGGDRLGTHDSYESAKKQLAAIEINKESFENVNEVSKMSVGQDDQANGAWLPKGKKRKLGANDGANTGDDWYVNGGYIQTDFPQADNIFGDEDEHITTIRHSVKNIPRTDFEKTKFAKGIVNENSDSDLLTEGGAYGHMNHPFDISMNLTFGDLKNIVNNALDGNLGVVREKTDGQALAISWKNGRLIAARNKGHLANSGMNALGIEELAGKFKGRGALEDAYNFAMKDLSSAISSINDKDRKSIFKDGKAFCNLEVIYPENANVIPYGQNLLVLHNVVEYDENGNAVSDVKGAESKLASMIKKVNADVQSKYTIQGPPITKLPKNEKLSSQKGKFNGMINKLQSQFSLNDSDGVADYHFAWWMKFVKDSKKKLSNLEQQALAKRWAFDDKSFTIKSIADDDARKWADGVDKDAKDKIMKGNLRKFEDIFLGVGAEVLSFMSSVLTVQPNKALQSIKDSLDSAISQIKSTGSESQIKRLEKELDRLNSIGGFDKLVPNEGLVFFYNGNTYKLTGTFAPLNQILGIFKFSR